MEEVRLQDLLAPTWKERARAADALFTLVQRTTDIDIGVWPEDVQSAVRALRPSPDVFLSALIGFWGLVAERQYTKLMGQELPPHDDNRWGNPNLAIYPLDRDLSALSATGMYGMWIWPFLARLGPGGRCVETQLVACLDHPEPTVQDMAEQALGNLEGLDENHFDRFVSIADQRGSDGMFAARSSAIARHVDGMRVRHFLAGIAPDAQHGRNSSRLAVVQRLGGNEGDVAHAFLEARLTLPWTPDDHFGVLSAYTLLSRSRTASTEAVETISRLVSSPDRYRRGGAAVWFGQHGGPQDDHFCLAFASDSDAWVRRVLCQGLQARESISPDILRAVAANCVGNYDAHDGDPHATAMALLLHSHENAISALPELERWWNTAPPHELERGDVANQLKLCEMLAPPDARRFLPGFERVLAYWQEREREEDLPSLDEPGAAEAIQAQLEQSMLDVGVDPAHAAAESALHGAVLHELAGELATLQAEFDVQEAEFNADRREIYPELYEQTGHPGDPADDEEPEPYVDELTLELHATIERLKAARSP